MPSVCLGSLSADILDDADVFRPDRNTSDMLCDNILLGTPSLLLVGCLTPSVPYHTSCVGLSCKTFTAYIALIKLILWEVRVCFSSSVYRKTAVNK